MERDQTLQLGLNSNPDSLATYCKVRGSFSISMRFNAPFNNLGISTGSFQVILKIKPDKTRKATGTSSPLN